MVQFIFLIDFLFKVAFSNDIITMKCPYLEFSLYNILKIPLPPMGQFLDHFTDYISFQCIKD